MNIKNRDLINLMDFDKSGLEDILSLAQQMKGGNDKTKYLQDKQIGMLFGIASTRTRISFQVATSQLGGHAEHYNAADLQLSNRESLGDTAAVMSREETPSTRSRSTPTFR